MDKVLITGASGLLGSVLVPALRASGHSVVTHARTGKADVHANLSDRKACFDLLMDAAPDVIINLVALTDVDLCQEKPNQAYLANTKPVENIAAWMTEHAPQTHLFQISTDQVYDGTGPHAEGDVALMNSYAFSKYAGELAALAVRGTVLRTNFVGRSRGARPSFSDWLHASLMAEKSIQVFTDVKFSPLSMPTLSGMIGLAIEKRLRGLFNVGCRDGMNKAEFCFALAARLGLPTRTMTTATSDQATFLRTYRPKDMRMDTTRFESALGSRMPSLEGELQRIAEEYDGNT